MLGVADPCKMICCCMPVIIVAASDIVPPVSIDSFAGFSSMLLEDYPGPHDTDLRVLC